jgi:hypothetical protein
MKKIKLILASLIAFTFIAAKSQAQTAAAPDYFAGKWDVLAKGIPGGDKHLLFTIAEKDGKLAGTMQDPETKQETPLTKVEKDDKGVVLYFTAQSYDVTVNLQKKDDDHVAGSMMGMFECAGERVKP